MSEPTFGQMVRYTRTLSRDTHGKQRLWKTLPFDLKNKTGIFLGWRHLREGIIKGAEPPEWDVGANYLETTRVVKAALVCPGPRNATVYVDPEYMEAIDGTEA